jgi:hypothetical protein
MCRAERSLGGWRRDEAGAVSVIFVLALPLVIAGLALSAQVGFWLSEQRRVQTVTDAAAYSVGIAAARFGLGCEALREEVETWAALQDTALRVATESGLPAAQLSITLTCPAADELGVEIARALPRLLLGALMPGDGTGTGPALTPQPAAASVIALTTGGDTGGSGAGDGGPELVCLHALARRGEGLETGGRTEIIAPECRIQVDSDSDEAIEFGGNTTIEVACITTRGEVEVPANVRGRLTLGPEGSACETIRQRTETEPLPPKLADLPRIEGLEDLPDDPLGRRETDVTPTRPHASGLALRRFRGGLELERGAYTFAPGLYVIDGGSFEVTNRVTMTVEDGAGFILINGAELELDKNADLRFGTGLGPGPWEGLVVFSQPPMGRDDDGDDDDDDGLAWAEFSSTALDGIVFLPGYEVEVGGQGSLGRGCYVFVAERFEFGGRSEMDITCDEEDRLRLCERLGLGACGTTSGPDDDVTGVVIVR